jgi:Secretion system C-terminal sorting domain
MKQLIMLAGVLVFTTVQTNAQSNAGASFRELIAKTIRHRHSGAKRVLVSKPLRAANYDWNATGANWDFLDSTFFQYNSQGMITLKTTGADATDLTNRETTTYDADYRITESLSEYYDAGLNQWVFLQRNTLTYDAQGSTLSDEYANYNANTSQWELVSGGLSTYSYNAQNQITEHISQVYDYDAASYMYDVREFNFTYNPFGNPLSWEEQLWDGSQWQNAARYTYSYDVNGFPLEAEIFEWDEDAQEYVPSQQFADLQWYNWNGDFDNSLPAYILVLYYVEATSSWEMDSRITYTYGANNSVEELEEKNVGNVFLNDFRGTQNFDAQGRLTLDRGEDWYMAASAWEISYEQANTYTYDGDDNLVQEINRQYDVNDAVLVNNKRHDYASYQDFDNTTSMNEQTDRSLQLYPNPMKESTTVLFNNLNGIPERVCLTDLSGKQVKTIAIAGESSVVINRDELKTGMYLVQILSGSKVLGQARLLID